MIFQGLSVTSNCLRRETVPLTIVAISIKNGLLCNFAKAFKGRPFYRTKQHGFEAFNY